MFRTLWLKVLQLVGLRVKTYEIKPSATFNPFGAYSATGVRRGSRWPWIKWMLVTFSFALLILFVLQPLTVAGTWVGMGLESISCVIAMYRFVNWADPKCAVCGYRTLHTGDCSYADWFRRRYAQGMYEL